MSRRTWALVVAATAAVLTLGAGWWAAPAKAIFQDWVDLLRFLTSPAVREISFRMETARTIVAAVRAGTLQADRNGRITLPSSLASATKSGRVYVTRKRDGLLLILFPTWQGKGANVSGYLFCSRPLTAVGLRAGDAINLTYNPFLVPAPPPPASVQVTAERKVRPNWWYVSGGLD